MIILAESKNDNELEKARNQMATILSDSRYIKESRKEDIDAANEVIKVLDLAIDACG